LGAVNWRSFRRRRFPPGAWALRAYDHDSTAEGIDGAAAGLNFARREAAAIPIVFLIGADSDTCTETRRLPHTPGSALADAD
jgi:hypothetical protein